MSHFIKPATFHKIKDRSKSGKTKLQNFTQEEIDNLNSPKMSEVTEFSPWGCQRIRYDLVTEK